LMQNDGIDLDAQQSVSREIKMYGVPIGLLLISSFRCQHFHIVGVLVTVGSFAYGEGAILDSSLSISVTEKTKRQHSLIRLSWFLCVFTASFFLMHNTPEGKCKDVHDWIERIHEKTMYEDVLCAFYHWVSRFELLLGMQVLTSYMLMTYKAPNAVGSAFYLAAQCHVPFASAVAAIVAVMRKENEVSKASYFMVAFVVCLYGWSPAVSPQPLWGYVSTWATNQAKSLPMRLPLPDEHEPLFRETVRVNGRETAAPKVREGGPFSKAAPAGRDPPPDPPAAAPAAAFRIPDAAASGEGPAV